MYPSHSIAPPAAFLSDPVLKRRVFCAREPSNCAATGVAMLRDRSGVRGQFRSGHWIQRETDSGKKKEIGGGSSMGSAGKKPPPKMDSGRSATGKDGGRRQVSATIARHKRREVTGLCPRTGAFAASPVSARWFHSRSSCPLRSGRLWLLAIAIGGKKKLATPPALRLPGGSS